MPPVAVVIPAYNEADRIAATVTAARTLPGVDVVVVVDDGSTDHTWQAARDAGARALRYRGNRGKGMAMSVGAVEVDHLDQRLSLIHISEPTRLGMISYAVFCLK